MASRATDLPAWPVQAFSGGDAVSICVDETDKNKLRKQLEACPLTTYTAEPCCRGGSRVSASNQFLAYALKGGQVRVLNLHGGGRGLLRGHRASISDLQFCEHRDGVLCSASLDGVIFVREILEATEGGITAHVVAQLSAFEPGMPVRISWAPGTLCFAAVGDAALFVDCTNSLSNPHGAGTPLSPGPECRRSAPQACALQDVACSPEGTLLAVATDVGDVRVWSSFALDTAPPMLTFTPDGQCLDVSTVAFAAGLSATAALLISGLLGNRVFHLGRVSVHGGDASYMPLQRIDMLTACSSMPFFTRFHHQTRTLFVCGKEVPSMFMVPLAEDRCAFRGVAAFDIEEPAIEFIPALNGGNATAPSLFCIHSRSLVRYDTMELMNEEVSRVVEVAGFTSARAQLYAAGSDAQTRLVALICDRLAPEIYGRIESILQRHDAATFEALTRLLGPVAAEYTESAKASTRLENQIQDAVAAEVEASLPRHVSAAVKTSLASAVRSSMVADVVPRFDAACRDMFTQTSIAVKAGLVQIADELRGGSDVDNLVSRLEQSLRRSTETADVLSRDVHHAVQRLLVEPLEATQARRASQMSPHESDVKIHLQGLLSSHDYDAAFSQVLSSSDVDLLAWTCSQLRPEDLFATGRALSPGVVLSLVQQLGCDVHRDPTTKASWIREAVLSVDVADPTIASHVKPVLTSVHASLAAEMELREGAVLSDLRLCIRVVQSLIRS